MSKVLITGITGQDGSYLAKKLVDMGHEVHGCIRATSHHNYWRHNKLGIRESLYLHWTDLLDPASIGSAVRNTEPDFIFNLAAQSQVGRSFDCPVLTTEVNAIGALNVFEAARLYAPNARVYQASTSEMFGNHDPRYYDYSFKLDIGDGFYPASPYGAAKLFAHNMVDIYRKRGLWICAGVLFNHESPLRGNEFVTAKICQGIAEYKRSGKKITLGNLQARRDWGHAKDFVDAMWLMLQQSEPRDMVIATGTAWSVQDFLRLACTHANITPEELVESTNADLRPYDIEWLEGDASEAHKVLGWRPTYTFEMLVKEMVEDACA